MQPQAAQQYLRTKVLTATPEQLQLMLYDGAIRFSEQGKAGLEKQDLAASHKAFTKAQAILNELNATLKHEVHPEMCAKLAALYNYAYRKLVEANVRHIVSSVDEALKVLHFQRETWMLLMEKLRQGKTSPTEMVEAYERDETFSVQG